MQDLLCFFWCQISTPTINQPPPFRSPYQPCLECAKRSEARSMVPKLPASASEMDSVEKIKTPPSSNTRRASWRNGRMEYLDLSEKNCTWITRFRFFLGDVTCFVAVRYFKERLYSMVWVLISVDIYSFHRIEMEMWATIVNVANLPQKILAIHLFWLFWN